MPLTGGMAGHPVIMYVREGRACLLQTYRAAARRGGESDPRGHVSCGWC